MGQIAKLNKDWVAPETIETDRLDEFINTIDQHLIHDEIYTAVEELFDIENPQLKDSKQPEDVKAFFESKAGKNPRNYGNWFYFPWSGRLVHFPPQEDLRALRTSRNRNLVTAEEQKKLYKSTILIAGMSVGSNVAEALVSQGTGGKLILIDMDRLEPSNFNRIRAPYHHVGLHKIDAIAQKISEIDPYLEQIHYKNGLNEENIDEVLGNDPDILIDEMDNVKMKILLRHKAKDLGLPVIMAADNGDNILLDIERYDKNQNLPLLHGNIPADVEERILNDDSIPRAELGILIGKYFVGFENTTLRMFQSLTEVGKTLPSWPQLGGAAALAGTTLAYCSKRIILDQEINSGRFVVGPDEQLNPEIKSTKYRNELKKIIDHLNEIFK